MYLGLTNLMRMALEYLYKVSGNYGLAIIALTLVIRVILYPFTWKQTESMEKMKALQPKLKELQEKYKDDQQEYQKRVMELYRVSKVNPLGGCLPLLLQLPFIWALFSALRTYSFAAEPFLWLQNLSKPDPMYILPALAGITTYIQGIMVSTDPSQKVMNFIGPFFMAWITIGLPSGIGIYFVVTNIFSIFQQYITARQLEARKVREGESGTRGDVAADPNWKGSIPKKLRVKGVEIQDEGGRKDR